MLTKGHLEFVACSGSFKLQTTRAIKCVTYKSSQFIDIIYEGFALWVLFSRKFKDGPFE